MEEYLLRLTIFNLDEFFAIFQSLGFSHEIYGDLSSENANINEIHFDKTFYLDICQDLDVLNIEVKMGAVAKLLNSFVKDRNANYLAVENLEGTLELENIQKAFEFNLLPELTKNLNYLFLKFVEMAKDLITLRKLKIVFYIKANLIVLFLIIYFNRMNKDLVYYVKYLSDDLEDSILKFLKLAPSFRFVPNKLLIATYYLLFTVMTTKNRPEFDTESALVSSDLEMNKAGEKKESSNNFLLSKEKTLEKYIKRSQADSLVKLKEPRFLFDFEKEDLHIEKFYRKNIQKKENSEFERVIVVNVLKVLLFCLSDNAPNRSPENELFKEYNVEMLLRHIYINNHKPEYTDTELDLEHIDDATRETSPINPKYEEIIFTKINQEEKESYLLLEKLNKFSISVITIGFYYSIIRQLQSYDLVQYSYFAFLLSDTNGLLVFLKFLNQNPKENPKEIGAIFKAKVDEKKISEEFLVIISSAILTDLKLIYKICLKNDDYICKYLIAYNIHVLLKRIYNSVEEEMIRRYCLKLLKIQLKYFDKNWRNENIYIISHIYQILDNKNEKFGSIDNWLKYEKKGQSTENLSIEELKKIHSEYHNWNYNRFLLNPEEISSYKTSLNSLYSKVYLKLQERAELPEDFKENYEKYV